MSGAPSPAVVCGDGVPSPEIERIARLCRAEAWSRASYFELDTPARDQLLDRRVILFTSDVGKERLEPALSPPVAYCLEAGQPPDGVVLGALDSWRRSLALTLSARSTYVFRAGGAFVEALARRGAVVESIRPRVELALSEALANAVIHGSAELGSPAEGTRDAWRDHASVLRDRLADDRFGGRPVTVQSAWAGGNLSLSVSDRGKGFNPPDASPQRASSGLHGRGLTFIHNSADRVTFDEGGRRITLEFTDTPTEASA